MHTKPINPVFCFFLYVIINFKKQNREMVSNKEQKEKWSDLGWKTTPKPKIVLCMLEIGHRKKKVNGMDSDLISIREITYPQIQTKHSRSKVFIGYSLFYSAQSYPPMGYLSLTMYHFSKLFCIKGI